MKLTLLLILTISLLSYGCQKRTHIYGFIGDEDKKPITGAKIAVVKLNSRKPSKTDTLASGYSHENGYQLDIVSRRRYKNVVLVNPYLINADLRDRFKSSQASKGKTVIPDQDCCKILIGVPNQFGFLLKK